MWCDPEGRGQSAPARVRGPIEAELLVPATGLEGHQGTRALLREAALWGRPLVKGPDSGQARPPDLISPTFFPPGATLPPSSFYQPLHFVLHRHQVSLSPRRHQLAFSLQEREAGRQQGDHVLVTCPLSALIKARPTECSANVEGMSDVNYSSWNSPEHDSWENTGRELVPSPKGTLRGQRRVKHGLQTRALCWKSP